MASIEDLTLVPDEAVTEERTHRSRESVSDHPGDRYLLASESDATPELTVLLPTLNEEAGIGDTITRVKDALIELEVTGEIIVCDSSSDQTAEIAEKLGAQVVEPDQLGYGYAYRYGFKHARGEYIVMGDADTTYDFRELPRLYRRMITDEVDMVIGSRFEGEIESGSMPWLHRYIGNPMLTRFLNVFYDAEVSDAHSGFRILTREVLEEIDLSADGMEFASEMLMLASAKGYRIAEEPITYRKRSGEPTIDSFRDGWRHIRFMLVNAPNYLFAVPGAFLFAIGLLTLGVSLIETTLWGVVFAVYTSIAGSLLTIIGYQVASLTFFSSVSSDAIRSPGDPVTRWIMKDLRLEHGATLGVMLATFGGVYSGWLLAGWLRNGGPGLPPIQHTMVGFTVLVIGVQTVFYSFFFSMLAKASSQ